MQANIDDTEEAGHGKVIESIPKEDIDTESMVFEGNAFHFQLANDAPITMTDRDEKLGHLANTQTIQQIVQGRLAILDENDENTALVFEEIG